jgi:MFS family permease
MCFVGGTPLATPLVGWISDRFGAPWGLISGGAVVLVAGLAAAAWLARGRHVRLEAHVAPPRLELHVSAPVGVPSARLRTAEEVAAEQAPGAQVGG